MSFNGSGTFVINSSGQPVVANTVISTTVFNALTADLATGLSTCITKDGQTTPTANIPMGTFKFTNLGVGSAATDSATLGQVQASTTKLVTVTGTDTITGTLTPALTAYTAGQMFYFVAGGANTGAVTLNIDGLGARNMTRHGSVALVAGDILSGEVCVVVYDGTRFQLLNPASYTNLNVTGVLALAAGTALLPSLAFTGDLNTGVWSPAADTLAASTGGVEALRVDSSGNVGVGTTTPGQRLDVRGSSGVALQVYETSTGNNNRIVIAQEATISRFTSTYSSGSGNFAWNIGGSEFMRLDSSGNLGIGTASPAERLQVTGNARIQNSGADSQIQAFGPNGFASFVRWGEIGSGDRGVLGFAAASNTLQYRYGATSMSTGTLGFAMDSSGNLGIGTASPSRKLTVNGTSNLGGSVNSVLITDGTFAAGVASITAESGARLDIGTAGANGVYFWANNVERLRIESSGSIRAGAAAALSTTATDGFLYVPTCAGTPTGTPTAITGMAPIVVNTTNNKLYFYSGGAWRDAGP